jgi:hypothetical protein
VAVVVITLLEEVLVDIYQVLHQLLQVQLILLQLELEVAVG